MYQWLFMKVLVAYMSRTGNTKKVAEAIYGAIPQPKEIKRVEDVTSLEGYDLAFLGFPMHAFGPDKQVKKFLETHVKDRAIALTWRQKMHRLCRDGFRNSATPL